jgi:hypothetical protein
MTSEVAAEVQVHHHHHHCYGARKRILGCMYTGHVVNGRDWIAACSSAIDMAGAIIGHSKVPRFPKCRWFLSRLFARLANNPGIVAFPPSWMTAHPRHAAIGGRNGIGHDVQPWRALVMKYS